MYDFKTLLHIFMAVDWQINKAAILRYTHGFCYFHAMQSLPDIKAQGLFGVQEHYEILATNTYNFCEHKHATNALLWGARGCGKSSIVKAVCSTYTHLYQSLRILEIESKDIAILPLLFDCMRQLDYDFIVCCDDLTFASHESIYHGLKSVIDGSIEQQATNIIIYATSNLRHLMPEYTDAHILHTQDSIHETLALSDRFPLKIGFYDNGQKEYLQVLDYIIQQENNPLSPEICKYVMQAIQQDSLNFATKIGNRNPRTAKNYYMIHHAKIMQLIAAYKEETKHTLDSI